MDKTHEIVKVTQLESGILQLVLNRPEALNALNIEVLTQLSDIFAAAKVNHAIKGLYITGEGKAFCAGADIKQLESLNPTAGVMFAKHGQEVLNQLEQLGKPSIAVVNGFALGGGCELAMAATMRVASRNAVFAQPEVKLGIMPGFGGTQRLARLIGKGRALDLCLTGRTINADEAYTFGLVTHVIAHDELHAYALKLLNDMIKLAPLAQKHIMTVIDHGYNLSLSDALQFEAAQFGLCCGTYDKQEGVKAFLEKRAAQFIGE